MQFNRDFTDHPFYIKSYDQQTKQLSIIERGSKEPKIIEQNCIITFESFIPKWFESDLNNLTDSEIISLIKLNPEIIILGVGENVQQLDYSVLEPLYKSKVPFEIMTTQQACRTYNLLASEHRKVVAALILK